MDSSVSPKDEIWFLRVCHHISNTVYQEYFLGGKGGRCVGLAVPRKYADCLEIWQPLMEPSGPALRVLYKQNNAIKMLIHAVKPSKTS
jgi:hypothetical protein